MIKAIIFDLWDTLIYADVEDPRPRAQRLLGWQDRPFEEFMEKFQHAYMTRPFHSLYDAFAYVCEDFGVKDSSVRKKLVSIWEEESGHIYLYPESEEVLQDLKSKEYRLGLLSNGSFHTKNVLDSAGISLYFNAVIISYQVGYVKPDGRIYREMLRRLDSRPEETMMVGDRIVDDVEGARTVGIRPVLLDRNNKYPDYPNKITSLRELERFL